MGLFNIFKKKSQIYFEEIDSIEKARKEFEKGNLEKLYILSPIFGGSDEEYNILYVPIGVNRIKEGYDNIVADLLEQEKVKSYNCKPEYKGKSCIPCKITIKSGKDGIDIFSETIEIW